MTHIMLAAMLGGWELVLIFATLLVPLIIGGIVLAIYFWSRSKGKPAPPVPPKISPVTVRMPRQCPKCGSPLNADAPEGLCPACLLQHGFATEGGAPAAQTPFVPPTIAELAKLFPQLEIISVIGKGGMGAVYKARQPALDRMVALKILAPQPGTELDFASRFSREAKALARLNHPNIVGVYDFGQAGGLSYFLMEFVDGPNLRQVQHAGKLSPREALEIIPQICAALQFAHDEGIVHRDIKPENVLLDKKGRVKIADFGLAKILGQEAKDFRLTGAKDVMGTPHYMAPEQVETPQEVDHRADIFSLGVVFYEMLTGELPLGKFAPPSQKVQVDVRLDEIVLRALEKEPRLRYQQASEFKTRVETVAAGPGSANAGSTPPIFPKTPPRFSRPAIVGALWLLVFLMASLFLATISHAPVRILLLSGGIGLLGGTICGLLSVIQIRQSGKRLCGLRLAVFEMLLVPVIAVDAVIISAAVILFRFFNMTIGGAPLAMLRPLLLGGFFLLVPLVVFFVDWLIVRFVWRHLTREEKIAPSSKPDRFWRRFAIGIACILCIPIAIAVFGISAAILIPNLVRERAHAQRAAERQRQEANLQRLQNTARQLETNEVLASSETPETGRDEENEPLPQPVFLSSGDVTFELMAVGSLSESNQLWWLPDGHPTTNDFGSEMGLFHSLVESRMLPTRTMRLPGASQHDSSSMHSYTFVFRSKGSPTLPPRLEIGGETVLLRLQTIFHPPDSAAASRPSTDYVYYGNVDLPEDQPSADCSLSFPAGSWMIEESIPNFRSGNLTGIKITCGGLNWTVTTRLEETNGSVRLTGSHPIFWSSGWDHQLILLAGDGSAYRYSTNESVINNGAITRMEVDQTYKNLSVDDVRDVRFRIRPFQQFSVRDISLQSGRLTTVEVTNTTRWKTVPEDFKVEPLFIATVQTNVIEMAVAVDDVSASVHAADSFLSKINHHVRHEEEGRHRADLSARFEAAKQIFGFSEKDSAMAAVARDAAAVGDAEIAKKALGQITAFSNRDDAARNAARRLAENGHRNEALEIARTITAFSTRDATLRELADK